jgi:hypothetical protein
MGFFSNIASAAVKMVAIPVAVVDDVITQGREEKTKELIESIGDDLDDALVGR